MPAVEIENHLTIKELADKLSLCLEKVRLIVKDEPGVVLVRLPNSKRTFYRIPESVALRIIKRMTNV